MESRDKRPGDTAQSRSLREAILHERLKEAESIDQDTDRRGSELARLEILQANLETAFDEIPATEDRFALVLSPTDPIRLWLDMLAYVAVDAATQSYRLILNGGNGRKILFETSDVAEMKSAVLEYVAEQIVARERAIHGRFGAGASAARQIQPERRGVAIIVWAFVMGVLSGVFCLIAVAYLITP